jgi:hypothetical protein
VLEGRIESMRLQIAEERARALVAVEKHELLFARLLRLHEACNVAIEIGFDKCKCRHFSSVSSRLHDGGFNGEKGESLLKLWQKSVQFIHNVHGEVYLRTTLILVLKMLMVNYVPDEIFTMDHTGNFNNGDHSDHHATGLFVDVATNLFRRPYKVTSVCGYLISKCPEKLGTNGS